MYYIIRGSGRNKTGNFLPLKTLKEKRKIRMGTGK
jgi:hypothetical protein